jgi:hypothetical protein
MGKLDKIATFIHDTISKAIFILLVYSLLKDFGII